MNFTNEVDVAFEAMVFARRVHAKQRRKYTNNPYTDHLAEVAGIVATVNSFPSVLAMAWLHDSMEDQDVEYKTLIELFGRTIAEGVFLLSDLEQGNRAQRKAVTRKRFASAPPWVQNVKCADVISNSSSILMHDPKFAIVYLKEISELLDVMQQADKRLVAIARQQIEEGLK